MPGQFKFTFGPWNIHEGADPFGPPVRSPLSFATKLGMYKGLGFDGVQFHDDDAVPELNQLGSAEIVARAEALHRQLGDAGLVAEFVAPRLWEDPLTIDGAYTSNDIACREYARTRTRIAIDIANALGTNLIVLWLAREGTYLREAKDSKVAVELLANALNDMLQYDPRIRIAIEPSPTSPWTRPTSRPPATPWPWGC